MKGFHRENPSQKENTLTYSLDDLSTNMTKAIILEPYKAPSDKGKKLAKALASVQRKPFYERKPWAGPRGLVGPSKPIAPHPNIRRRFVGMTKSDPKRHWSPRESLELLDASPQFNVSLNQ